jgi:hypothetical protein
MTRRLLFIELNEFNHRLMVEAADVFALPHIKRMLALPHQSKTVTADSYESGYLEPWVQWVSVHTGKPASEHKIKHLGDVRMESSHQIWEALSDRGISSGIWSAMNATRGSAEKCKFFLPDPWTFEEKAYPSEINSFLDLPRYMARNYLKPRLNLLFGAFIKFALFMCRPRAVLASLVELPGLLVYLVKYRAANFVTYSFAEYLSAIRFLDYWEESKPEFSSLFLNLVAHAQHYYWADIPLAQNDRLKFTFTYLDKILGVVFRRIGPDTDVLVANGLTQMNTNKEPAWILYRQKDHQAFLARMGISEVKVEACMTHDAHLFFKDKSTRDEALRLLTSAKIGDKRFFYVEEYPTEPFKLFYMIEFTDPVEDETILTWSQGSMRVLDEFSPVVRRTAKHVNSGIALSTKDMLPHKPFPNHELYQIIMKYFGLDAAQTS